MCVDVGVQGPQRVSLTGNVRDSSRGRSHTPPCEGQHLLCVLLWHYDVGGAMASQVASGVEGMGLSIVLMERRGQLCLQLALLTSWALNSDPSMFLFLDFVGFVLLGFGVLFIFSLVWFNFQNRVVSYVALPILERTL